MSSPNNLDGAQSPSDANAGLRRTTSTSMIQIQPLKRSEMQPSYAQDLEVRHVFGGHFLHGLGIVEGFFGAIPCCCCGRNPNHDVREGSVGLISRFGQFYKAVDPGLVQVNVRTESINIVDVKIQILPIGRQTIITSDDVYIDIDSDIYFQIFNPYKATFGITDLPKVLIERAQLTLRHVVGARKVQSVLTDRDHEAMSLEIAEIVGNIAEKWGVAIDCFLIKGVVFSPEVSAAWSAAHRKTTVESRVMTPSAEVASTDIPVSVSPRLGRPSENWLN